MVGESFLPPIAVLVQVIMNIKHKVGKLEIRRGISIFQNIKYKERPFGPTLLKIG